MVLRLRPRGGKALSFGDPRLGASLLLLHVAAVAGAAVLLLCWMGLGGMVRRRLTGGDNGDAVTRWVLDPALGAGVLATVLFGAGVLGVMNRTVVLALTLALAALSWRPVVSAVRGLPRDLRAAAPTAFAAVPLVAVALLILLLLAGAVAPPTEWDSLMYHLRIPLQLLERGGIALPADSFHVALVGVAHFATLPLLAAGLPIAPAVMQVLTLVLVIAGTFALARRAGLSWDGRWLAVAALIGCPILVLVGITARVDVALMLPLLGAHLALSDAAARRPRDVYVAAVLLGIAMGTKPLAGAYALALVPLGLRAAGDWRRATAAAAIAFAIALPWHVKNLVLVGAPLYPVGASPRFEPWLAELFGSQAIPAGFDTAILRALSESRAPFHLLDAFRDPLRLTIESEGRFYALSPLLVLVPLVVIGWRSHRTAVHVALIGLAYAAIVVVPFGAINLRYLMPALPALAVAATAAVDAAATQLRAQPGVRRIAFILLAIVALRPLHPALTHRFGGNMILIRHAVGVTSARDVWHSHPDAIVRDYARVLERVHRAVPPDARVLLLWESRALPLDRPAIADVMLSNWSYLAQSDAPDRCLAGTGVTHVLMNTGAVAYYVRRGADRAAFRLEELDGFRKRCAVQVDTIGDGFELLTLRRATR